MKVKVQLQHVVGVKETHPEQEVKHQNPRGSPQGPRSTHGCLAAAMSPWQPTGVAQHGPCEMEQGQRQRAELRDTAPPERKLQVQWTRRCFEQDAGYISHTINALATFFPPFSISKKDGGTHRTYNSTWHKEPRSCRLRETPSWWKGNTTPSARHFAMENRALDPEKSNRILSKDSDSFK